jgi:hypothetical protein
MLRLLVGLIKGLVVGGGVGYGLLRLGWTNAVWIYIACALVGALVGVVCGRAPWKSDTIWTPVVKAVVGSLIGVGLCALGRKVLPETHLFALQGVAVSTQDGSFLATAIGVLYGMFVEVDDGGKAPDGDKAKLPPASPPKQLKK